MREEVVPHYKSEIRTCLKRLTFEKMLHVEMLKEEAIPLQVRSWSEELSSERKRHMEAQEKEKVPFCKVGIHTHPERPVAEKGSHLETKEEVSQF